MTRALGLLTCGVLSLVLIAIDSAGQEKKGSGKTHDVIMVDDKYQPEKITMASAIGRLGEDPWKEYWGLRQRISDGAMRAVAAL